MQPGSNPGDPGDPGNPGVFRGPAQQAQQAIPDLQAALAQAQQMQQQLMAVQQRIAETEVQGQAGGGLVTVTLNGHGQVTRVHIDPSVVDPADVETLQDLIVGALGDAAENMKETVKTLLAPLSAMTRPPQPEA